MLVAEEAALADYPPCPVDQPDTTNGSEVKPLAEIGFWSARRLSVWGYLTRARVAPEQNALDQLVSGFL